MAVGQTTNTECVNAAGSGPWSYRIIPNAAAAASASGDEAPSNREVSLLAADLD